MLVLAFDTASEQLACILARVNPDNSFEVLACEDGLAPRSANSQLVGRIRSMFDGLGLAPSQLDCVVCGRGPGSFTGVRIGVATAKGIATGLHVPLHGVSTLDAIAWGVQRSGYRGELALVADAMRKEVYPVSYSVDGGGIVRNNADKVAKPLAVAQDWAAAAHALLLLCGDGLAKFCELFEGTFVEAGTGGLLQVAPEGLWRVTGEGLLAAFCDARAKGQLDSGDAGSLLPVYTRLSDAEENERARAAVQEEVPTSGVADARAQGGLFLRPLARTDLPAVVAIERASFKDEQAADAWSERMFADELGRADRCWWVAVKGGELVGYAGGWVVDGGMQLLDIAVDEGCRKQGVAQRLIQRLAQDGLDLGAGSFTLEVRENNTAAQALYTKLGLACEGVRPHYYPGGMDAYIMTAPLPLPAFAARKGGAAAATEDAACAGIDGEPSAGLFVAGADGGSAPVHTTVAGMELKDSVIHGKAHSAPTPLVLAIESSCDETAAAVIDGEGRLLSDCLASQIDFHARFGGVVPEIASRKHIEAIVGVAEEALAEAGREAANPRLDFCDLDAIAVTSCPGLVGALVVGIAFAKGLAWACSLPLVEVNHLEGHIYANKLITPDIKPPLVALLVSGGHTMLVHVRDWGDYETMGSTLDDAAGEAFDKVAKALGLGYPGGPVLSRLAKDGNPEAIDFPRAMLHSGDLQFSLSGLKTAVMLYIKAQQEAGADICLPDLAASFQQAVIDVQVAKAVEAVRQTGVREFCLGGGVAANPALREALSRAMGAQGVRVTLPPLSSCTDNAGMIAAVALERLKAGKTAALDCDAKAHALLDEPY